MNTNNPFNTEITETQTDIPVYPNHGRVFNNRYRLIETIGTGGMGRVYKALDEAASEVEGKEKYVAIKVLLPQLSHNRRAVKRLQREALRAQELRHEHIVGVYNFDSEGDWTYLLMEWLDGESLEDTLDDELGGLALETVTTHLKTIGKALSYAHNKGVIHRDIKPNNMILTKEQRLVLIDFGLSQEAKQSLSRLSANEQQSSGTVVYMPPEALVAGHPATIKDDIYGLAATIYELLTGDVPFIEAVCYNRTAATPLPHKPPQLDETQWQVLSSALAFNPDDRPDSVASFVSDFCSSEHKEKQQQKELINILADKPENATNKPAIKEKTQDQISCDDTCVQRIWDWADEFEIDENDIPRNKSQLLALRELVISDIGLTYLPPEIGRLSQLQGLDVCSNNLSSLPPEIGQLSQLQELSIGDNELSSLPPEIGQLSQLRTLWVGYNQLSSLPPELWQLSQLQKLDVYKNQLSSLPPELWQLSQLQELSIGDNELSSLPPEIGQLSQLQKLNVGNNQLSSLPPEIGQLSQLQGLDVCSNNLSSLPPEIRKLSQLQGLWVQNNQLSSLPPEIGQLSQLQELDVCSNNLSSLPPEIGKLSQLQELDVCSNNLSSLPPEIGKLSQLQGLWVQNNQLSSLPESITRLTNLKTLNLEGNRDLTNRWFDFFGSPLSREQKAFIKTIKDKDVDY